MVGGPCFDHVGEGGDRTVPKHVIVSGATASSDDVA